MIYRELTADAKVQPKTKAHGYQQKVASLSMCSQLFCTFFEKNGERG